jgi:hypothetical protein
MPYRLPRKNTRHSLPTFVSFLSLIANACMQCDTMLLDTIQRRLCRGPSERLMIGRRPRRSKIVEYIGSVKGGHKSPPFLAIPKKTGRRPFFWSRAKSSTVDVELLQVIQ